MSKHYDKQFKEDAVKYYLEHKELGLKKCAENLAVSKTALGTSQDALEILKKATGILGN